MNETDNESGKLEICNDSAIDSAEQFNFESYVKAFEEIITNPENETPLSIVINGRWGCGKTSLMKTLKKKLETNLENTDKRKIKTIWFNAWKYSNTDQLLASLVREIYAEMDKSEKWRDRVSNSADKVNLIRVASDLLKIVTAGTGPDLTKWEKVPEYVINLPFYELFQDYLDKSFNFFDLNQNSGAFVFFIDDLDRCSPKAVTNVLETINLFFDKPGCIFVLGMDMEFITMAIKNQYKDFDGFSGKDYLDKMIQVRFDIPRIRDKEFKIFIGDNLKDYDLKDESKELILAATGSNPRKCKQFVNTMKLMISLGNTLKTKIDEELVIKWLYLTYHYQDFVNEIKVKPDLIDTFQKCSSMSQNQFKKFYEDKYKDGEEKLSPSEEMIKSYFGNPELLKILKDGKQFNANNEPETHINNFIHLSAVAPVNVRPGMLDAEIDGGIYIDRPGASRMGFLRPNERYYFFYHFKVPEGKPMWTTSYSTRFLVNGQLVEEGTFIEGHLNGENYGVYEYEFPEEGEYEIEIRGVNSIKMIVKVKKGTAFIPKKRITIQPEKP